MKYILTLTDGMADYPIDSLGGKTPMEAANKPTIDFLAKHGVCGMIQTVPESQSPGSDNTNLSICGYDPLVFYTGRSPLEAASIGIELNLTDVTYRCNFVTLSDEEDIADCTMLDYSANEITTPEADELIKYLAQHFNSADRQIYTGTAYRHCLVLRDAADGAELTPPHDISLQPVRAHLPKGTNAKELLDLMIESRELLKDHPVNKARIARGLRPANCCWFWGEGRKPALTSFKEKFNLDAAMISAVDLLKGIAICAGMDVINVPNVTGNIDTNFEGKGQAAIEVLKTHDFVYVHVEAPDECGHRGEIDNKILALEFIDKHIVAPIKNAMDESGEDYIFAVLPDHRTPICRRTHTKEPIPFIVYRSFEEHSGIETWCEKLAETTGVFIPHGQDLIPYMISGKLPK